jgi:hypothetical protein
MAACSRSSAMPEVTYFPLLGEMLEWARNAAADFEYEHRLLMPDGSVKYAAIRALHCPDRR